MKSILFPTINASLNALAGLFLIAGYLAIKKTKNKTSHKRLMITAMITSTLFLCCYLYYHANYPSTKYEGQGIARMVYFAILITHIPLAAIIVPFSLMAIWHGWKDNVDKHVKIVKWLFPTWMYVSVTGVLIYLMLYILPKSG